MKGFSPDARRGKKRKVKKTEKEQSVGQLSHKSDFCEEMLKAAHVLPVWDLL